MVDEADRLMGFLRDHRVGGEGVDFRSLPPVPETREGEGFFPGQMNEVGSLALSIRFPLVPSVGGSQASPVSEGIPKEGLFRHGFRTGVDAGGVRPRLLRPIRNQTPSHSDRGDPSVDSGDYGVVPAGAHVEGRVDLLQFGVQGLLELLFRNLPRRISSAHQSFGVSLKKASEASRVAYSS